MNVKDQLSFKRVALSKANTQIVAVTAIAAFITVFCLVAANYFLGLRSYQAKILSADHIADSQLKTDVTSERSLVRSYTSFVNQNPNVLGQSNTTTNGYTYNNTTIVLDALPSTYDFPALTSSLQKLLLSGNFDIASIGGQDESSSVSSAASGKPQPVEIPFTFTVNDVSYQSLQSLFKELQESVRPIAVDNMTINGSDTNITLTVTAHTYFQPAKEFKIGSETIKR